MGEWGPPVHYIGKKGVSLIEYIHYSINEELVKHYCWIRVAAILNGDYYLHDYISVDLVLLQY